MSQLSWKRNLAEGTVIPAMPLALNAQRRFDESRQRALLRYYRAAGAGGLAVGVHTTQFAIRDPEVGLFEPLLRFVAESLNEIDGGEGGFIRVAGICGKTAQAIREAEIARDHGYHAGLLSLSALAAEPIEALLVHAEEVGKVLPIFGFYLQPAVGGRILPYEFWRRFAELPSVLAIKMAPFNRYQTLDVARAVCESSRREEIALYTGNDDNIVADLLTRYVIETDHGPVVKRIVGGLLGHWAVWTRNAVELLSDVKELGDHPIPPELMTRNIEITDCNAAFFDAAHSFAGCIAGIHHVLTRQGLLDGEWCLDPEEVLSPGQKEEIERVYRSYPHLNDDDFVSQHLTEWLN